MRKFFLRLMALLPLLPMPAAAWQAELDPVAYDFSTRDSIAGDGRVDASVSGDTLRLTGNFRGLSSSATVAHLRMGAGLGIPGDTIADFPLAARDSGTIAATIILTPDQRSALATGRLYIQIDSVQGTDGSLWGWFLPPGANP